MPDIDSVLLILSAARRDLKALEHMLDSQAFPSEIFGFHAQQSVEKTLKAWLTLLDQENPRTHNIRQLLLILERSGVEIDHLWDFVDLTAFAVQFRYEAFEEIGESIDRPEILAHIQQLIAKVESLLPAPPLPGTS